jgi:hypothetical protein
VEISMHTEHPLLSKLARTLVLSEAEGAAIRAVAVQSVTVKADAVDRPRGRQPLQKLLVAEGVACTSKVIAGGKRQIMALHIQGDMPISTAFTWTRSTATSGPSPTAVWTTSLMPTCAR